MQNVLARAHENCSILFSIAACDCGLNQAHKYASIGLYKISKNIIESEPVFSKFLAMLFLGTVA